jgi:AraC-like DNA-binding protein
MDQYEVISAVQRIQDYMEKNLNNPITLSELAKVAGYSQWYTVRIFKEYTKKTPFDYLRALRLSRAALLLRDGKPKVIDVAFDFVFSSHEGFSRAFFKQFGVLPKKYCDNPKPIKLFMPYRLIHADNRENKKGVIRMSDKKTRTIFVQVMERPSRKAIIKRGIKAEEYFDYCKEVGCDIWGILTSIKEAMYEPVGMWLPENMIKKGTSKYVQGVEVSDDYSNKIPDGFEVIELKACKMMIFQGEPFEDEEFEEAILEVWDTIKKYNPTIYGFEWADEEAPKFQLEPQGYRGYIEARPVKQVNNK